MDPMQRRSKQRPAGAVGQGLLEMLAQEKADDPTFGARGEMVTLPAPRGSPTIRAWYADSARKGRILSELHPTSERSGE
jgi:hypothetical protein